VIFGLVACWGVGPGRVVRVGIFWEKGVWVTGWWGGVVGGIVVGCGFKGLFGMRMAWWGN